MSDTSVENIYETVKNHEYPIHIGVNNCFNTTSSNNVTTTNTNSVEKSMETNGFVVNLEKPYYLYCEDKVKREEMIKPLIDYAMTNLYEPLNYVKKQNIQQYNNIQPYNNLNHNNFLYHQMANNCYNNNKANPQSTLNGYGEKSITHAYNNVIPYETHYQQQYNVYDYINQSHNVNYNVDKTYTYIDEDKCSTESSDHSEVSKSRKEISSIGDHSTEDRSNIDNHSENAVSNSAVDITNEELPFGNLLSRYNEEQCIDLSNDASIQSNETIQSNNQKHSSVNTINAIPGLKYTDYSNYYYTDQMNQPLQRIQHIQGLQNSHMMDYKKGYPQQMYNTKDSTMDSNVYSWQWPMYKIPQGIYQQNGYKNATYQNMYGQRLLYNKSVGDKWNMDNMKDKSSGLGIKRGKNSSAGRPRLNRSDYACSKCRARTTPQWRYLHGVAVCNACYMRARKEKMRMKRS